MSSLKSMAVYAAVALAALGTSCVLNLTGKGTIDDPTADTHLAEQLVGRWSAIPDSTGGTTAKHALLLRADSAGTLHPTYVQDDTLIDTSGAMTQVFRALGEWSVKDGALTRTPQFCFSHDTLKASCAAPAAAPVSLNDDLDTLELSGTMSAAKTVFWKHPN
jgi:hypothetical protein